MGKLYERVDFAANVLVIVMILGTGGFLIQKYFFSSPTQQPERLKPTVGSKVNLTEIKWAEKSKTLILALQTTCRFCNESAAFYKKLVESVKDDKVKLVAVFPSSADDGKDHLTKLGVNISDVYQSPLNGIKVSGTPTLILTNDKGEITDFWVGKLSPEKEAEVIEKVNL